MDSNLTEKLKDISLNSFEHVSKFLEDNNLAKNYIRCLSSKNQIDVLKVEKFEFNEKVLQLKLDTNKKLLVSVFAINDNSEIKKKKMIAYEVIKSINDLKNLLANNKNKKVINKAFFDNMDIDIIFETPTCKFVGARSMRLNDLANYIIANTKKFIIDMELKDSFEEEFKYFVIATDYANNYVNNWKKATDIMSKKRNPLL